ncbi:MAG: DUF4976 domain-containing protein, partial [Maribacter sp.]|nr:DUF4976 domain-containing protein [Maribacter sp.]
LIHFYYDVDVWEFYDLKKDPQEMSNVYNNPKYASIVKEVKQKMAEVRKKYKDSDELSTGYIELYKEKGWIKE